MLIVRYDTRKDCTVALFRGLPEGEHTFCYTCNSKANNNGNDAITEFTGKRDSRRRQIDRVPDIQSRERDGMSYTDI